MAGKRSCNNINIPLDLTLEILKKLPAKSLARFQCVSKQWISMIKDFIVINSIVTRSLNQPRLRDPHFIFEWVSSKPKLSSGFSYAYPHQITNEKQLYCEEIFEYRHCYGTRFQYVRGLIGFWNLYDYAFRIYNPTTRQSVSLPIDARLTPLRFYLFGYDPVKNQYKVVCLTHKTLCCHVFTLGDPKKEWRNIQYGIGCHFPFGNAVCIKGKIYYKAKTLHWSYVLVSFDVWSQNFNHVQAPLQSNDWTVLNYQGKLAYKCSNKDVDLWVMENFKKQEWFKITFFDLLQGLTQRIRFADVTNPGGEIVIVHEQYLNNELESNIVYYFDPK